MIHEVLTVAAIESSEDFVKVIAVGGGMIVAVFWLVTSACVKTVRANQAEKTRREIAAYIAEGTISPEQGERLMRIAGSDPEEA